MSFRKYLCLICGNNYKNTASVDRHLPVHYRADHPLRAQRKKQCPFCPHSTDQQSNLNTHINAVHLGKKTKVCGECGKGFSHPSSFLSHRMGHGYKPAERKKRRTVNGTGETKEAIEKLAKEGKKAHRYAPYEQNEAVAGPSGTSSGSQSSPNIPPHGYSSIGYLAPKATLDYGSPQLSIQEYNILTPGATLPLMNQSGNNAVASTSTPFSGYWGAASLPRVMPQYFTPLAPFAPSLSYTFLPPAPYWAPEMRVVPEAVPCVFQSGSFSGFPGYTNGYPLSNSLEATLLPNDDNYFDQYTSDSLSSSSLSANLLTLPSSVLVDRSSLGSEQASELEFDSINRTQQNNIDGWTFSSHQTHTDANDHTEADEASSLSTGLVDDEEYYNDLLRSVSEPEDDASTDANSIALPALPPPSRAPTLGLSLYDEHRESASQGGGDGQCDEDGEFEWEDYLEGFEPYEGGGEDNDQGDQEDKEY